MKIPNDPYILASVINTKLRDCYDSLDELCKSECIDGSEITEKLEKAGFHYKTDLNQFV